MRPYTPYRKKLELFRATSPAKITARTTTVDPEETSVGDDAGHEALLRRSTHKDRRIVRAVEGGMSKSGAARLFGVSLSSVKRYLRIAQRGMSLAPRKAGRRPPKTDQSAEKLLEEDVKKRPAATTVSERRHFLEHTTGKS